MIIFHHVIGRLVRWHENYLKLSRRFALFHQFRVEITQNGREVATRRTPSCRKVDPHHFVPQRLFGVDEIPVLVEECPSCEHLHHDGWKSQTRFRWQSPAGLTALRVVPAYISLFNSPKTRLLPLCVFTCQRKLLTVTANPINRPRTNEDTRTVCCSPLAMWVSVCLCGGESALHSRVAHMLEMFSSLQAQHGVLQHFQAGGTCACAAGCFTFTLSSIKWDVSLKFIGQHQC